MTKRILIPDRSLHRVAAGLDYAIEFSRTLKAKLILLHALEPAYFTGAGGVYGVGFDAGLVQQQIECAAREQSARLAGRLKAKRLAIRTALPRGRAAGVVTDAAGKLKPDPIIMATHGRTVPSHALLGSVAERAVRTATCPVLTALAGSWRVRGRFTSSHRPARLFPPIRYANVFRHVAPPRTLLAQHTSLVV